jgi:hypothetical protein
MTAAVPAQMKTIVYTEHGSPDVLAADRQMMDLHPKADTTRQVMPPRCRARSV